MADPSLVLHRRFGDAIVAAFGPDFAGADPVVRPSDHADFQANGAMALAKRVGRPPREVADALVAQVELDDVADSIEVSGPGFVNVTLKREFLAGELDGLVDDQRLGVRPAEHLETIVIDYSAPNLAKEMHI